MSALLALLGMTAAYAGQGRPAAPPQTSAAAAAATPASIANGEMLFRRTCQICHGSAGLGDGPAAKSLKGKLPNLADKAVMSTLTDAQLHELISNGRKSDLGMMPGMAKRLKTEEITDIVNYVRTLAK